MQKNNQNPDVNSPINPGTGSDIEQIHDNESENSNQEIPLPPDTRPNAPIEEPPEMDKPSIDENNIEPQRLV